MAQPPPTASSLLPNSLFDSIKTYLMNIDVSAYTEYEEEAKKSEMWFLGESSGSLSPRSNTSSKKELRKLEGEGTDLDFGTLPQYPTPSVTDYESDTSGSDNEGSNHVLNLTPRNRDKQPSGFTDESDVIYERSNLNDLETTLSPTQGQNSVEMSETSGRTPTPSNSTDNENRRCKEKEDDDNSIKYDVAENDSLNTVALKFNISPNMLKQLNALTSEIIFPGQKLLVPLQKMQSEMLETVLHPVQKAAGTESPKRGKQFYKYYMKRITRFDGSVVGTTLLTSNAFMFRADVTNKLAIEHGHANYNVSIPLDSVCEVLMFESFEQMLANIQNSGTIAEDDCPKCISLKVQLRRKSAAGINDNDQDIEVPEFDNKSEDVTNGPIVNGDADIERTEYPQVKVIDPARDESESKTPTEGLSVLMPDKARSTSMLSNMSDISPSIDVITSDQLANYNPKVVSHDNCESLIPPGIAHSLGMSSTPVLCQHEFEGYHLKYSSKRRVNPFNFNTPEKKQLILPKFKSPLMSKEELEQNQAVPTSVPASVSSSVGSSVSSSVPNDVIENRIHRVESDTSLATQAFFKKIDDHTTHLQNILDNANKHDFPIFISIHSLLCTRTHGKPSFQCEEEEGHKKTHFWFSLSEKDIAHLIDRLFLLCSHLDPVDDSSNCLLQCPPDYYQQLDDIILPDVQPKFVPREVDTDLMYEPFSGSINYNSDIAVMMTEGMMAQLQPYLPCHIIGIDMVLLYSLRAHGMTLKSLYQKCAPFADYPCLLLVKDTQGYLFGSYMSHGVIESPKYYGSGETFLFRLSPDPQCYFWQGDNHYFMMGTSTYFTIGAGDGNFALYVDEMLQHGTSNRSQTFYNEVLSSTASFDILDVEVWCFTDEALDSDLESSSTSSRSMNNHYMSGRYHF